MLFQDKYERARKLQRDNINKPDVHEEYHGEKLYEPTIEEQLEKGDMFALMVSGLITILPVALLVLLLIVFISWIFLIH